MELSALVRPIFDACPDAEITIILVSRPGQTPAASQQCVLPPVAPPPPPTPPASLRSLPPLPPSVSDHQLLQSLINQGVGRVKITELANLRTIGQAELRRAAERAADTLVTVVEKVGGKDSKAWMVCPGEVLRYLQLRTAVVAGTAAAPDWWGDVVKVG